MQRRGIGPVLALAFVAATLIVFRAPFGRALIAAALDVATGYRVAFDDLVLRGDRAVVSGLRIERNGDPVFDADRVVVRYRLRDLLPGGSRRYGLVALALERPRFVLVRHADWTFNVPLGGGGSGGSPSGGGGGPAPLVFSAAIDGGSIALLDATRTDPATARLSLEGITGRFAVDTANRTSYRVRANLGGDASVPLRLAGTVDEARGFGMHRLTAPAVPLPKLLNYLTNVPTARGLAGVARDVDLHAYALGLSPGRPAVYHLGGQAEIAGAAMTVPGIQRPVRNLRGRVDLFDDGVAARRLDGDLGGIPLRLAGAIYGWAVPSFRLGIAGDGSLEGLRGAFHFAQALPVAGDVAVGTLVEGPAGAPLVLSRVASRHAAYAGFPLERVAGTVVYENGRVDIVGAGGRYGPIEVASDGGLELGDTDRSRLFVEARGPAGAIPYAAQATPRTTLEADAVLTGENLKIDARGVLDGGGGGDHVGGLFHVDPSGDGAFGPLEVRRNDGTSVAGAFYLDRIASESGFWLDARGFRVTESPRHPRLPHFGLWPPDFSGRIDAALAGEGPPSAFRIAGVLHARDLRVGRVTIDDAEGRFAGAPGDLRLGGVRASGPWGAFSGDGGYTVGRLALAGTYRGGFAALGTLTGDVGAVGPIFGPVALVVEGERTTVQALDDATPGARIRGVPVDGLDGTLAVEAARVRLYAARGAVAGGTLAAAGALGDRGRIGVSLTGVDAARLGALAPLGAGRLSALGDYGYDAGVGRFDGGLAVGTEVAGWPVAGNGDIHVSGTTIALSDGAALLSTAFGTVAGTVVEPGSSRLRYDLGLHVRDAQVGPLARAVAGRRALEGTVSADFRLRGGLEGFALGGHLAVPDGSVNGLSFGDAAADLALDPTGVALRHGTVRVGSTRAAFGAALRGADGGIRIDAPQADLSDFNDLFDAGDTLAGRGRVAARFFRRRGRIGTSADVAIAGLRYRRFDLGDMTAKWTSNGPTVVGALAFGGTSGRLQTSGTLQLAARAPLDRLLGRSRFHGRATLRGLDLDVWLPALGYQLPVGGRLDADAVIGGAPNAPEVRTRATIFGGHVGRLPIGRLSIAAASTLRRTSVTSAALDLPALSVTGSGSFGLGARDPVAFSLHGKSSNVGAFAGALLGTRFPVTGAAEADVKIDGPFSKPRISGGFDLESATVVGVSLPQALGEFSLQGPNLVVSGAEIVFPKGTLDLAGSLPLTVAPFGFGPASAPMTLELAAKGIDLSNFASLLPKGSILTGQLDGRVNLGGTAGNPQLLGELDLSGGTLATPLETDPLTNLSGRLSFDRNTVALESLRAEAGGGTLDLHGRATFPELVHPSRDATYAFSLAAAAPRLNFPAYGFGRLDGNLSVSRVPGELPLVSGSATIDDAVIPFSALLLASTASGGEGGFEGTAPLPAVSNVALDLNVAARRDVRVRSANVDIGGQGDLAIGGTLFDPRLNGRFISTGGTLTYFNTVFRLLDGTVTFEPDLGVIPTLDAHATTHLLNSDPNVVRNASGTADVSIAISGPVTNMNIALSSDPPYDRQQILGLLLGAPALGATNLFTQTGAPTPYGSASTNPLASTSGLAPGLGLSRTPTGELSVGEEAFGILNAQFTRNLLAPIESGLGSALGLSSLDVNVDYTGSVGFTARKILGRNVNALYGTSFGYPYRQTFGFELKPNAVTAAQVTVFQTLGAYGLSSLTPVGYTNVGNQKLTAAQPAAGTVGFSLSLQRLYP